MKYLLLLLLLAAPAWADTPANNLAKWQANMLIYGKKHCAYAKEHIYDDPHLNTAYYDGERIYYQIADYTGDSSWNSCAQATEWLYRDNYFKSPGGPAGYWNFARGLALDYKRTGDQASSDAVTYLADTANWCRGITTEQTALSTDYKLARELAYCIDTFTEMVKLGRPAPRLSAYLNYAKADVNRWVAGSVPIQSFMAALMAEALIKSTDIQPDAGMVSLIGQLVHAIDRKWDATNQWWTYIVLDTGATDPEQSTDLNLLIAPAYAWMFKQTGDSWYALRYDQAIDAGVNRAWLVGAKQFNQNYRWSIDGFAWRFSAATSSPTPTAAPTPIPTPTPCGKTATLKNHQCRLDRAGL